MWGPNAGLTKRLQAVQKGHRAGLRHRAGAVGPGRQARAIRLSRQVTRHLGVSSWAVALNSWTGRAGPSRAGPPSWTTAELDDRVKLGQLAGPSSPWSWDRAEYRRVCVGYPIATRSISVKLDSLAGSGWASTSCAVELGRAPSWRGWGIELGPVRLGPA